MRVYRIEHSVSKKGCYTHSSSHELTDCMWSDGYYFARPGPNREPEFSDTPWRTSAYIEYFFGFASIEQFQRWFDTQKIIGLLHREGFIMRVFDCDDTDVIVSQWQAAFRIQNAKEVEKMTLDIFLKDSLNETT